MTAKKVFNVDPVQNKDKQIVNNYCPVSMLPIYYKILDKLVFDAIVEFVIESNLLSNFGI